MQRQGILSRHSGGLVANPLHAWRHRRSEIMPEHFHILISEPAKGNVARVMQVLKQRVSRNCRRTKKAADQISLWKSPCTSVGAFRVPTLVFHLCMQPMLQGCTNLRPHITELNTMIAIII
jgi:hypothetical protein